MKRSRHAGRAERASTASILDHTTFRLPTCRIAPAPALKLVLRAPRGVAFGLALVGRIGNGAGARVISVVRDLPNGGTGAVRLSRPGRFARITAVLVNADIDISGFSAARGDWVYTATTAASSRRRTRCAEPPLGSGHLGALVGAEIGMCTTSRAIEPRPGVNLPGPLVAT